VNPRAAFLLILAALVVLAAVIALIVWQIGRQAGVRLREYKRVVDDRNLHARAIADIAAAADLYRDIDSVLATQVRDTVRTLNSNRMDLTS
jgi:hypothetical protein